MASSAAVSVTDSPVVALATGNGVRHDVWIRNLGPNSVYLGGSAVTSAAGTPLNNGDDITLSLGESETLYGVCATGETASLRVFQSA